MHQKAWHTGKFFFVLLTYYFFYFLICLKEGIWFLYNWSVLLSKNRTWFISLVPEICLKNRFRVAVRLLSNRSQMTLKVAKAKKWHTNHRRVCHWCDTWDTWWCLVAVTHGENCCVNFVQFRHFRVVKNRFLFWFVHFFLLVNSFCLTFCKALHA